MVNLNQTDMYFMGRFTEFIMFGRVYQLSPDLTTEVQQIPGDRKTR